jgi:hypothetical protein
LAMISSGIVQTETIVKRQMVKPERAFNHYLVGRQRNGEGKV